MPFGVRYVDNRCVIASEETKHHPGLLTLCDLDFLVRRLSLRLLIVTDFWLSLSFSVNVAERIVQYRPPDWRQIRDCVSAGSVWLRVSELKSRAARTHRI